MASQLLDNKKQIQRLSQIQYNFEPVAVKQNLIELFADNAKVQLSFPF